MRPLAPSFQQYKEFREVVRLRPDPVESSRQDNALTRAESFAPALRVGDPDRALGYEANLLDEVISDLNISRIADPDARGEPSAPVGVVGSPMGRTFAATWISSSVSPSASPGGRR